MKVISETNLEQETWRFFEDAKQGLDSLKKARDTRLRQETWRFFEGAKQGLDVLRPAVIELDRHLARRFNFFHSIAFFDSIPLKREDRMSNVFAYLLDPDETHGQGTLFLEEFLKDVNVEWLSRSSWSIGREVLTTRIENRSRKIDIEIAFQTDDGPAAIAIENKPWNNSTDEPQQLSDYARHLELKYKKRFKLIYLTPDGRDPSEESITCEERNELAEKLANASIQKWADHGWLKRAEDEVKAERVRWFVSDFRKALIESLPAQQT